MSGRIMAQVAAGESPHDAIVDRIPSGDRRAGFEAEEFLAHSRLASKSHFALAWLPYIRNRSPAHDDLGQSPALSASYIASYVARNARDYVVRTGHPVLLSDCPSLIPVTALIEVSVAAGTLNKNRRGDL